MINLAPPDKIVGLIILGVGIGIWEDEGREGEFIMHNKTKGVVGNITDIKISGRQIYMRNADLPVVNNHSRSEDFWFKDRLTAQRKEKRQLWDRQERKKERTVWSKRHIYIVHPTAYFLLSTKKRKVYDSWHSLQYAMIILSNRSMLCRCHTTSRYQLGDLVRLDIII